MYLFVWVKFDDKGVEGLIFGLVFLWIYWLFLGFDYCIMIELKEREGKKWGEIWWGVMFWVWDDYEYGMVEFCCMLYEVRVRFWYVCICVVIMWGFLLCVNEIVI